MLRTTLLLIVILASPALAAEPDPEFTRTDLVVYGEKLGMALTMDVIAPKANANGRAIVFVMSGGWYSDRAMGKTLLLLPKEFLRRGYTVFQVYHGTQPKFSIPEILEDIHRSVRFIRYHAADYKIDPDKIGIYGGSAGGHLSLMQGMAGNAGNPAATDPVDKVSSRVQAVACFFPPTDFLNYGKPGEEALGTGTLAGFPAPFAFTELKANPLRYEPITDSVKRREIGKQISPITHVTADDPPTLIVHGDKDFLVPIQQAEVIVAKLKEVGVPAKLVVKEGAAHGWTDWTQDIVPMADWFDEHLK
jgi:acetyl esterase/lipase